jgi:hypothetical protein
MSLELITTWVFLRYSLFWVVRQRMLFLFTDILRQPVGPIFKTGHIGCPKTSENNIDCVATHKSEGLTYTGVEA